MKKKNQSANGRYISVEKLQKALSNIEINEKKNDLFCSLKKIHHLCSDLHLKQASRLANYSLRAFFMSIAHDIVPTPVWSVNAPTVSHPSWTVICSATGQQDRLFCLLNIIIYNRKYFS